MLQTLFSGHSQPKELEDTIISEKKNIIKERGVRKIEEKFIFQRSFGVEALGVSFRVNQKIIFRKIRVLKARFDELLKIRDNKDPSIVFSFFFFCIKASQSQYLKKQREEKLTLFF